jgi:hypothetical protein
MLQWANVTLQPLSAIHWAFSRRLTMSNFSSLVNFFNQFFIWIALGDIDYVSLILVTKANAIEGGTTSAMWLYHQHNPHMWLMAQQWHHFLLASNTRQVWPGITYAKSCHTENCCLSSMPNCAKPKIVMQIKKIGVNFHVALKWNRTKRICLKWDLLVVCSYIECSKINLFSLPVID